MHNICGRPRVCIYIEFFPNSSDGDMGRSWVKISVNQAASHELPHHLQNDSDLKLDACKLEMSSKSGCLHASFLITLGSLL